MKTYKHLFEQIATFENLYQAWRNAARGKRGKTEYRSTPAPPGKAQA